MTWKTLPILCLAICPCLVLGQADFPTGSASGTNSRLSEEQMEGYPGKIGQ